MLDSLFGSNNIENNKTKGLKFAYKCCINLLLKKKFFKMQKSLDGLVYFIQILKN